MFAQASVLSFVSVQNISVSRVTHGVFVTFNWIRRYTFCTEIDHFHMLGKLHFMDQTIWTVYLLDNVNTKWKTLREKQSNAHTHPHTHSNQLKMHCIQWTIKLVSSGFVQFKKTESMSKVQYRDDINGNCKTNQTEKANTEESSRQTTMIFLHTHTQARAPPSFVFPLQFQTFTLTNPICWRRS